MKSFRIIVILSDGDRVESNVAAENQAAALSRLKATPQFLDFVGSREIAKVDISAAAEYVPASPGDYVLQKSEIPGCWVVADRVANLVITFEEGRYGETAKITFLNDREPAALESAVLLRKIGEFLAVHHPGLV